MNSANQIFVRFYLLIVLSVVFVGWSVDWVWESFYTVKQEDNSHQEILRLATQLLAEQQPANFSDAIDRLNRESSKQFQIIPLSQIKADNLHSSLLQHEIILLQNLHGDYSAYQLIPGTQSLLVMNFTINEPSNLAKYSLLFVFYGLIAIIVYWRTRPLARDLNALENAANRFTDSHWDAQVEIAETSPIRHLANTYNQLLRRIGQLIKEQQEMSHAISHELRTPLARIKFSIEKILSRNQIEVTQQQLQSIDEDVCEIQSLVDELLSYANLQTSQKVATIEKGDIGSLLMALIEKLQRNSPSQKLKLANPQPNEVIYCDSYLIERALQNLIINALYFCHSQVLVSFEQQHHRNRLIVDDDGPGILPSDRERIFNSFVRLDNPSTQQRKGFGLGLAIVKRIALLHHGTVKVEKSPLGGARIMIEWPANLQPSTRQ